MEKSSIYYWLQWRQSTEKTTNKKKNIRRMLAILKTQKQSSNVTLIFHISISCESSEKMIDCLYRRNFDVFID